MVSTRIRTALLWLAALAALAATASVASAAAPSVKALSAGRSPISGIQDDRIVFDANPDARVRLLADAGAALIRVDMRWDLVAGSRPANPANPADPAYNWAQYDAVVAAARKYGVEVLFSVYGTPAWARDPSVPFDVRYENWAIRPLVAGDLGAFAEAASRRYGPLGVKKWEGWNEPNISLFLRPQYARRGNTWVPVSPGIYSDLLKAFYAGIKRGDPTAVVAGAVTAPAGDRCPKCPLDDPPVRVTPDEFVTALNARALRPPMDVVSHHPYPFRAPADTTPPRRTYVDFYNLDVLTKAIDRTYLRGKRLWLTEYGFGTRKVTQYPFAFGLANQGPFIADAYRRAKANRRVAVLVYYLLQDHPQWASGVLTRAGTPKPGYQAIGLPFAATVRGPVRRGSAVTLVGQARVPVGVTAVNIQRKAGGAWVTIKTVRTSADGSFKVSLRPSAKLVLRARWSGVSRTGANGTRTSPAVTITVR
jgi:hypothetical protein